MFSGWIIGIIELVTGSLGMNQMDKWFRKNAFLKVLMLCLLNILNWILDWAYYPDFERLTLTCKVCENGTT